MDIDEEEDEELLNYLLKSVASFESNVIDVPLIAITEVNTNL